MNIMVESEYINKYIFYKHINWTQQQQPQFIKRALKI